MPYLFLILTILSESVSVICMKLSAGFQHTAYTVAAIITYALSFVFLTLSLRTLQAGVANGIWAGASTVLIAIIGWLFLNEKLNTVQVISIGLITAGLIGLNFAKANG